MSTWIKKLTEAFSEVNEKKKMDPVGQEDGDIDNDGDKDSSDEYLAKRRKAIGKAMKENDDEGEEKMECPKCKGEGCDHCDGKGYHTKMDEAYESVVKEMKKMHDEGYGKKAIMAKYNHMDKATLEKLYASSCGGMRESAMAQKAKDLAKASEPSAKGKKSVTLPKAPWDKKKQKNEEDVIMNPKKEKDKKAEADIMANESVEELDEISQDLIRRAADKAGKKADRIEPSYDKHYDAEKRRRQKAGQSTDHSKIRNTGSVKRYGDALDKKGEQQRRLSYAASDNEYRKRKHYVYNREEVETENKMAKSALPPVYARILEERAKHYKGATPPEGMMDNSKSSKGAMDMVNQPKDINNDDEKGHDDASKAGRVGPSAKTRPGDNMKGDKKVIPSATPMKGK